MRMITLRSGFKMPALGLGTWKTKTAKVYDVVRQAIECGYRHIDCAPIYMNQEAVGRALQDAIQAGDVTREELWITSKLWNTSHAPDAVLPAFESTLKELRLDYLDLYLMHWPVAMREELGFGHARSGQDYIALEELPLIDTWQAMEALPQECVRTIGVSNFSVQKIDQLCESANRIPAVNQVECHPYLQQQKLYEACHRHNIHLTAYSPLGSGDRPDVIKQIDEPVVLRDPVIARLAAQLGITSAQLILAWLQQRGWSVIPKSSHAGRLTENLASADVVLSEEVMDAIAAINQDYRLVSGSFFAIPGSPYSVSSIWDE